MASIGDMTVRLRVRDEVTPVLRGLRRELWMLAHPRIVLSLLVAGWSLLGFVAALLAVVFTGGRI